MPQPLLLISFLLFTLVKRTLSQTSCLPLGDSSIDCVQLNLPTLKPNTLFPQHNDITKTHNQSTAACALDVSAVPTKGFSNSHTYSLKITSNVPGGVAMMWLFGTEAGDTQSENSYVTEQTISWTAPTDSAMESFYAACGTVVPGTTHANGTRTGGSGKIYVAASRILFHKDRTSTLPPKYCPSSGTNDVGCTYEELGCTVQNSPSGTNTKLDCRNQTIYGRIYMTNMPSTIKIIDMSRNEIKWINPKSWKKIMYKWPNLRILNPEYSASFYQPFNITEINLSHNLLRNVDDLITPTVFPCVPPNNDPKICAYTLDANHLDYGTGQRGLISIEKLHLQNNSIASLQPNTFETKSSDASATRTLAEVNVNNNPLDFLQANCELSPNTKMLSCKNKLPSTTKHLYFQHLPRLRQLDVSNNQLSSIDTTMWSHSRSTLESIDISMNQFTTIHRLTKDLVRLKTFKMNNNNVTNITYNQFQSNNQLTDVNLQSNPLDFLQHGCTLNPNITELNCENQQLTGTVHFQHVPSLHLKIVNMKNNAIEYIHEDTFSRSNQLETIDLSHNALTFSNAEGKPYRNDYQLFHRSYDTLHALYLNGNNITSLHQMIKSMTKLVVLDISNNEIHSLSPWQFVPNTHLQQVHLQSNPLDFVQAGCVLSLDLKVLNCKAQHLTGAINFQDIPSCWLEKIDFADNQISTINPNLWLPANETLQELQLSKNNLTDVVGLTANMSALKKLHILENPVATVPFRNDFVGHLGTDAVWYLGFTFRDGSKWDEDVHCTKSIVFKNPDGKKICAYEYCNAHDHLKKKFCHGNECNTTAQAANCENHFFDHGISEKLIPNVESCNQIETMHCNSKYLYGNIYITGLPKEVSLIVIFLSLLFFANKYQVLTLSFFSLTRSQILILVIILSPVLIHEHGII